MLINYVTCIAAAVDNSDPTRYPAGKATRVVELFEVPRCASNNYRFTVKASDNSFVHSLLKNQEVA